MAAPARYVGRPETKRLIAAIHTAFGIVRRPARGVLEQADGPDAPVSTQIEPVMSALRHADQVVGFTSMATTGPC